MTLAHFASTLFFIGVFAFSLLTIVKSLKGEW
jgi:hypothetical protein